MRKKSPLLPCAGGLVLLALALAACRTPPTNAVRQSARRAWFSDGADASGLHFTHVNGMTGGHSMTEIIGSGVALFDYDNDGDLDVFLVADAGRGPAQPGCSA